MKKFISVCVLTAATLAATAQKFEVTAGGNPVADGETLTVYAEPEEEAGYIICEWDPQLYVRSLESDIEGAVGVTTDSDLFSICWPSQCVGIDPGVPVVRRGTFTPEPADLQIHCNLLMKASEATDFGGAEATVMVQPAGGEMMTFTLKCLLPEDYNSVGTILPDSEVKAIYDLAGRRLTERQPGVNIVVYGNGQVKKELNSSQQHINN